MKSFLALFALLVLLSETASAASVKGVRGNKRSLVSHGRTLQKEKEKKCKKFAEPKAVADKLDPKATDPKATDGKLANPKAAEDPKAGDPKMKEATKEATKETLAPKATPEPKEDKKATDLALEEAECLEWEEFESRSDEGSEAMVDPTMTSTGSTTMSSEFDQINVDCDAIANDNGPTDVHSVSFSVNIDVLKDAESKLNDIFDGMEKELQQKVAPRIAGCSSSGRFLASDDSSSKIVHVDFGEMEFDHQGCDSSLAKEAAKMDGVCMASDVPVDVYFVGDFPENAMAKVEVAIEEHVWGVDGLLKISEVAIVQTASTMGSSGESNPGGMIGGIVAAIAACLCLGCGYKAYQRSQDPVAKAELETDEESSDDEKKVAIPEVQARRVK